MVTVVNTSTEHLRESKSALKSTPGQGKHSSKNFHKKNLSIQINNTQIIINHYQQYASAAVPPQHTKVFKYNASTKSNKRLPSIPNQQSQRDQSAQLTQLKKDVNEQLPLIKMNGTQANFKTGMQSPMMGIGERNFQTSIGVINQDSQEGGGTQSTVGVYPDTGAAKKMPTNTDVRTRMNSS